MDSERGLEQAADTSPGAGAIGGDMTSPDGTHTVDDRFIPVRVPDLAAAIEADRERFGDVSDSIQDIARLIEKIIGREAATFEREMAEAYDLVNPDRECLSLRVESAETSDALVERFRYLFDKANFEELDDAQIESALSAANSQGLRVRIDPDGVELMSLWVRGRSKVSRRFRTWRHPIRGETRDLDVYLRLLVLVRLKGETPMRLKLFREIPVADIEALLPHAHVQMSLFDKVKVLFGGVGVIGTTAFKVAKLLATVVVLSRLLWVIGIGFGVLIVRGFLGYRTARHSRDFQRTQHLYYQNLANNEAVIHTLVSMICFEEVKEALLAYALCARDAAKFDSVSDLGAAADAYLKEAFGVRVRFDVEDAVRTLDRLDGWASRASLRVRSPAEWMVRLEDHARDGRTDDFHVFGLTHSPESSSPEP